MKYVSPFIRRPPAAGHVRGFVCFLYLFALLPGAGADIFTVNFTCPADSSIVVAAGGSGFSGLWVQQELWPTDQGSFLRVTEASLTWPGQNFIGGHLRFHGGNGSYRKHVVRRSLSAALTPGEYVLSFVYQNSNPSAPDSSSYLALRGANDSSLRISLFQSTQVLINGMGTGLGSVP